MKILYRISDAGYNKVKPTYVNNESCLKNFCNVFFDYIHDIIIIADNCSDNTLSMVKKYIDPIAIEQVSVGHGAGTFNLALDKALKYDQDEVVYFVENDYLHRQTADTTLLQVFKEIEPNYATLYDHPDKYIPANKGGNPYIDDDGGELTKLYLAGGCHWKLTNSTTMTFAARVKTLKEDESILRKWTGEKHPNDFQMFLELREKGRTLVSSVPGYATHGETAWLSPLTDWSSI
jgi:hypothetical protein